MNGFKHHHPQKQVLFATALTFGAAIFLPTLAQASAGVIGNAEIDITTISINVLGGLAIFLFGMDMMNRSLKEAAGEKMSAILRRLTSNRIMGMITGAFVTAVVQSSSVTTVMLVGFVTAGLMSFAQTLGVILGADIGTTITTQIVAFKVTKWAPLFITFGFAFNFLGRTEKIRQYGNLVLGMGLIFFGMGLMSQAMEPLRSYQPFIDMMGSVSNPLVGVLIATLFTGLIQASAATMGVVVVLAMHGLIDLEGGIAMTIGANIGTCVTAGLAAIGRPREAVRVAVAHVSFKIAGGLLLVGFIPQFAELVRSISPAPDASLVGSQEILAATLPRQVANAHSLFNIGLALAFLPMTGLFARFCYWILPEGEAEREQRTVAQPAMAAVGTSPVVSAHVERTLTSEETATIAEIVAQAEGKMVTAPMASSEVAKEQATEWRKQVVSATSPA
ncbi:MAG: Na/Pi cotransporter family protein [Magnetococcales bacterium]|nr:Na/Pi cotransporter family protein [Magnetococcales bacterium]